jgi:hypothetical protein
VSQNSVTEFTAYNIGLTKNLIAQSFIDTGFFTYIDNIAAQAGSNLLTTNFVVPPGNNGNVLLTAADAGKVFFLTTATAINSFVLPTPTPSLIGTKFTFITTAPMNNANGWAISAGAANRLFGNTFAAVTGPGLNIGAAISVINFTSTTANSTPGDRIELMCIGAVWVVMAYGRLGTSFVLA